MKVTIGLRLINIIPRASKEEAKREWTTTERFRRDILKECHEIDEDVLDHLIDVLAEKRFVIVE